MSRVACHKKSNSGSLYLRTSCCWWPHGYCVTCSLNRYMKKTDWMVS